MHYDAGCQCTQGLLLADYFKSIITGQNLPPDLDVEARNSPYYKQYDPSQPNSIARPNEIPQSNMTRPSSSRQPGGGGNLPPAVASNWGYGFNVQMWYFSQDAKGQTAGLIKQAGFNWMKVQVEWFQVETAPGVSTTGRSSTRSSTPPAVPASRSCSAWSTRPPSIARPPAA